MFFCPSVDLLDDIKYNVGHIDEACNALLWKEKGINLNKEVDILFNARLKAKVKYIYASA